MKNEQVNHVPCQVALLSRMRTSTKLIMYQQCCRLDWREGSIRTLTLTCDPEHGSEETDDGDDGTSLCTVERSTNGLYLGCSVPKCERSEPWAYEPVSQNCILNVFQNVKELGTEFHAHIFATCVGRTSSVRKNLFYFASTKKRNCSASN